MRDPLPLGNGWLLPAHLRKLVNRYPPIIEGILTSVAG